MILGLKEKISQFWVHLKHNVQLLSYPVQESKASKGPLKMTKELEHLSYQESLRELLSLEKERQGGILSISKNNWYGDLKIHPPWSGFFGKGL